MTADTRVVDRHVYDNRLTPRERLVMLMHRHIAASDGPFAVNVAALAHGTGLTVAQVENAVEGLVAKGWLVRAGDDA